MNTPADNIEALTGILTIPVTVAAQMLGISLARAKRELPCQDKGYRTRVVSIDACRAWISGTRPAKPTLRRMPSPSSPSKIKILRDQ